MTNDERDALRYRWLRARNPEAVFGGGVFIGQTPDNVVLSEEDADAAIDAAMALEVAAPPPEPVLVLGRAVYVAYRLDYGPNRGKLVLNAPYIIVSIGRRWAKIERTKGHGEHRFDLTGRGPNGPWDLDGGGYASPGMVFASTEGLALNNEAVERWRFIRENTSCSSSFHRYTLAQLRAVSTILNRPIKEARDD